ncbi:hypothetical protein JTB14_025818 [Gonioctena quinquepunctata]|nr:hypothetical protein JTB14_025818 [Gonioctena quinquepunctata]
MPPKEAVSGQIVLPVKLVPAFFWGCANRKMKKQIMIVFGVGGCLRTTKKFSRCGQESDLEKKAYVIIYGAEACNKKAEQKVFSDGVMEQGGVRTDGMVEQQH